MRNLLISAKWDSLNVRVCFQYPNHSPLKSCLCFKCPRLKKVPEKKKSKKIHAD